MTEQSAGPGRAMPFEAPARRQGLSPAIILVGLTILAAVLRFYRIGEWGLSSDEVFMQRDSINLRLTNPRPLMYFLNHYVVRPFMPLDEFGLRLLPAICGVLVIPAFYLVTRRMVDTQGCALWRVSPRHQRPARLRLPVRPLLDARFSALGRVPVPAVSGYSRRERRLAGDGNADRCVGGPRTPGCLYSRSAE